MSLGVALKRVFVSRLEMTTVAIRDLLLADVSPTRSSSNPTVQTTYLRAQKCSPEKFRSLPHSRAIALLPLRNPITEATGCLSGMAMAQVYMIRHQMPFANLAFPFAAPAGGESRKGQTCCSNLTGRTSGLQISVGRAGL